MTVNVEYNQLDPLLRATINPQGDVNDAKTGECAGGLVGRGCGAGRGWGGWVRV
jgi:hypothetical protein